MNKTSQYDVIISGGGLSGLLTAIGLINETPELSIAIIEPVKPITVNSTNNTQQATKNFDDRCLALSYGSLQLLNHWHVWPQLKPLAWPIKTIITSDRGHIGKTIMRAAQYDLNAMGYVAAMRNMGAAFTQSLNTLIQDKNSNLTWYTPNNIKQVSQQPEQIQLVLDDQQTIAGKLLVVAEGGNSPTRKTLKISTSTQAYEQSAIIANIQVNKNNKINDVLSLDETHTQNKHNGESQQLNGHTAFERFTTSGPIAFLPIDKDQYSVVWSVKPEQVEQIMGLPDTDFCQQLQSAFGHAGGVIVKTSKRESYPLGLTKAESIISDRVVLVGNSAHTIHPIAGQGFNLGLRDVAYLVKQIKHAVDNNVDIGAFSVLQQYQAGRVKDINRITGFTDLLVKMFALEGRLPALTRTLGLLALQKVTSLQQWFALHFMSSKV
ncbi:FAD-dependent monooxygenase [Psychrosphaera sp. F3M07]|uniref:FAD-dependent monooxygenase n=1 Tax=Psychrosphaera sp. F3M07 TaxID=2841560 RepID=UPI001C0873A2|nr:FAD-dependent monooxygenase [Psychrosphaera sp. F3M07]MBU2918481.1 FAD-dependent monooxygenase [Psychrosphaera sp. F3M07]